MRNFIYRCLNKNRSSSWAASRFAFEYIEIKEPFFEPGEVSGSTLTWKKEYPFKSHKFTLKSGHAMHYLDEGQGDDIVLMVHGNPTWSFFYRNLVLGLKDQFRCIVPDHIGCGLSDKPQDYAYRLKDHINNLLELIQHLKPRSIRLIVHDWGGAIGMAVAEQLADKVEKIVILNTAAFRSKHIPFRIALCRMPFLGEFMMRAFNLFAKAATIMTSLKALPKHIKEGYLHPYNSWKNRIAIARFVQDIPLDARHPSYNTLKEIEEKLPVLADKPMMICWGAQDFCFNDHFFNRWKKYFPKAQTHYFKNAGHYILEDVPAEVLKEVKDFL